MINLVEKRKNGVAKFKGGVKKSMKAILVDKKGEIATNTIGAIILGVVFVGLLIAAINSFFPDFFTTMFNSMSTKLNGNW